MEEEVQLQFCYSPSKVALEEVVVEDEVQLHWCYSPLKVALEEVVVVEEEV